ncbi:restriction endonuclease subunit S [Pedobacter lithocola]|uniref:Restriction endonuclease subunit S n=1 Tax=Pedobacter lithocola TaxID=1908239 RepID=A0ABV8PEQ6_9SPHI
MMKFGLTEQIIKNVNAIFEENSKVDKAIIFGSRAKGNFKEGSDIDIAIKGQDLGFKDILKLTGKLDDLDLSYKIDLLDYHNISEPALTEHIDRMGVEFYSRWKEYKLSTTSDVLTGFSFKGDEYEVNGNLKVVRGENVTLGALRWDSEKHWNKSTKDLEKYFLKENDIVIGMDGSRVGKNKAIIKMNELPLILAQRVALLRAKKDFYQKYIWYNIFSKQFADYVDSIHTGTSIPHISQSQIGDYKIAAPPKNEQKEIASVLSSLDDKIDLLQRQNKTLEQLAETLFRQWFIEEAEEGWETKKLGELITITSSKRIFYSEYVSNGVPFYRSKEIIELRKNGSTNSELYISNERFDEIDIKFGSPQEGDILMTSVGTLGVAYRVKKSEKFYFKDGNLTWFKDFKQLPSSIIYLWLISKLGQEELGAIKIGSTQEALTIEGLKNISFRIPPSDKIKEIEIQFIDIIRKMDFNQLQIKVLENTRDDLLTKLLSGEIRVHL